MSDRKGILKREQEQFLGNWLDEKVKAKGLVEAYDGLIFRGLIRIVDDYAVEKLDDELKVKLSLLVDLLIEKEYENAVVVAGELLDVIVDIPNVDDEEEAIIFTQSIQFILNLVKVFSKNK